MTLVLEKSKKVFTKPRRLLIAKESEASRVQTQTCGSSRYRLPMGGRSRRCSELVRVQQRNQIPVSDRRRVSRFMWVRPLKDRKTKSVIEAFQDILSGQRRPKAIRPDKGSEFYNRYLQKYMTEQDIKIFYALNETKDNFAVSKNSLGFCKLDSADVSRATKSFSALQTK